MNGEDVREAVERGLAYPAADKLCLAEMITNEVMALLGRPDLKFNVKAELIRMYQECEEPNYRAKLDLLLAIAAQVQAEASATNGT